MATIEQILGQDNGNIPDSLRQMYPKVNRNFNRLNTELTDHKADTTVHLTPTKDAKLAGIEEGAQVNQNALAKINDVEASTPTDQFFIVGGLGITVSTNPTTKQITVTATGDTAPAAHGATHNVGGADEIPDLSNAVTAAQSAKTSVDAHIATKIYEGEAHGMRVTDGVLEWYNGTEWVAVKSGSDVLISNLTFYVDAVSGNDNNDGLTASTPLKTIIKVGDLVRNVNSNAGLIINLSPGTYSRSFNFTGLNFRGTLDIRRVSGATGEVIIDGQHSFQNMRGRISIYNITFGGALIFRSCNDVLVSSVKIIGSGIGAGGYGIYCDQGTKGYIAGCQINNSTRAIYARELSYVLSANNTGTSNAIGLVSVYGSTIVKYGTQPSATTAEQSSEGGLIRT